MATKAELEIELDKMHSIYNDSVDKINKLTNKFNHEDFDQRRIIKNLEKELENSQLEGAFRLDRLEEIRVILIAFGKVWFPDEHLDPDRIVNPNLFSSCITGSIQDTSENILDSDEVFQLLRHLLVTSR